MFKKIMGCTSSTEYSIDPVTGKEVQKKRLGGAYPGQRRPQHAPYQPDASQFGPDGKAIVHFMAYGGGNALTLVQQNGSNAPQSGGGVAGKQPEYIQVTLPDGVEAGQTIHVQAPDGRLNAIVIPPGFGPGSTFTVEFAPESAVPPMEQATAPPTYYDSTAGGTASQYPSAAATAVSDPYYNSTTTTATAYAPVSTNNDQDDGFATGFNAQSNYSSARPY